MQVGKQFDNSATRALAAAFSAAKELGHTYIGSEHLLLGLLWEKGSGAEALLASHGVYYAQIKASVCRLTGVGEKSRLSASDMSSRLRSLIESAAKAAKQGGYEEIKDLHLVYAVVNDQQSGAYRLLSAHGCAISEIGRELSLSLFRSRQAEKGIEEKGAGSALEEYGKDLTLLARQGRIDPVRARERESERVIEILSRRTKNNPCLLGEPGVGKTAIVEGLASLIAEGMVPSCLRDKRIVSLDIASMIAGAKYRGEFEQRMKRVMDEVLSSKDVILFVDEIHTVVGAGSAEGAVDAANIIKPALARREMQMIGATTLSEYRKHIEKDPALERRFQPVMIEEPSGEACLEILAALRPCYEKHHGVKIGDDALLAAVSLSRRYINGRFLPDKAIDLIDESCARKKIDTDTPGKEGVALLCELKSIEKEKSALLCSGDFSALGKLREREREQREAYVAAKEREEEKKRKNEGEVSARDIARTVSAWTGVPVDSEGTGVLASLDLFTFEARLNEKLIGQKRAVGQISRALLRIKMGFGEEERPLAVFLLAGGSGVGKTMLARLLAKELYGGADHLFSFDMGEYSEAGSVSKLIGAPPGYIGYSDGGRLCDGVRSAPYSMLLFENIEKAHTDVLALLYSMLDCGVLNDSLGKKADFRNCTVVMTTGVGFAAEESGRAMGFANSYAADAAVKEKGLRKRLKQSFGAELLERVDEAVVLDALDKKSLLKIAERQLEDLKKKAECSGVQLELDRSVCEHLVSLCQNGEGARPIKRLASECVVGLLADAFSEGRLQKGEKVLVFAEQKRGITYKKISPGVSVVC